MRDCVFLCTEIETVVAGTLSLEAVFLSAPDLNTKSIQIYKRGRHGTNMLTGLISD